VGGEVRPQYFVYRMLEAMGDERISAHSDSTDLWPLAATGRDGTSVVLANYDLEQSRDYMVSVNFSGLIPGPKLLKVLRIDGEQRWSREEWELIPLEQREVDTPDRFAASIYCPGDSVSMVVLSDITSGQGNM
jgi:hypothetical protein